MNQNPGKIRNLKISACGGFSLAGFHFGFSKELLVVVEGDQQRTAAAWTLLNHTTRGRIWCPCFSLSFSALLPSFTFEALDFSILIVSNF